MGTSSRRQRTQHPPHQAHQHHSHTHDSSTARRGSGSAASCSWPPCSLPSRMMSQRVWEALDCLWKDKEARTSVGRASLLHSQGGPPASFSETCWTLSDPIHFRDACSAFPLSGCGSAQAFSSTEPSPGAHRALHGQVCGAGTAPSLGPVWSCCTSDHITNMVFEINHQCCIQSEPCECLQTHVIQRKQDAALPPEVTLTHDHLECLPQCPCPERGGPQGG